MSSSRSLLLLTLSPSPSLFVARTSRTTVSELEQENEELNLDLQDLSDEFNQLQEMHDQLVDALADARAKEAQPKLTITVGSQTDAGVTKVRSYVGTDMVAPTEEDDDLPPAPASAFSDSDAESSEDETALMIVTRRDASDAQIRHSQPESETDGVWIGTQAGESVTDHPTTSSTATVDNALNASADAFDPGAVVNLTAVKAAAEAAAAAATEPASVPAPSPPTTPGFEQSSPLDNVDATAVAAANMSATATEFVPTVALVTPALPATNSSTPLDTAAGKELRWSKVEVDPDAPNPFATPSLSSSDDNSTNADLSNPFAAVSEVPSVEQEPLNPFASGNAMQPPTSDDDAIAAAFTAAKRDFKSDGGDAVVTANKGDDKSTSLESTISGDAPESFYVDTGPTSTAVVGKGDAENNYETADPNQPVIYDSMGGDSDNAGGVPAKKKSVVDYEQPSAGQAAIYDSMGGSALSRAAAPSPNPNTARRQGGSSSPNPFGAPPPLSTAATMSLKDKEGRPSPKVPPRRIHQQTRGNALAPAPTAASAAAKPGEIYNPFANEGPSAPSSPINWQQQQQPAPPPRHTSGGSSRTTAGQPQQQQQRPRQGIPEARGMPPPVGSISKSSRAAAAAASSAHSRQHQQAAAAAAAAETQPHRRLHEQQMASRRARADTQQQPQRRKRPHPGPPPPRTSSLGQDSHMIRVNRRERARTRRAGARGAAGGGGGGGGGGISRPATGGSGGRGFYSSVRQSAVVPDVQVSDVAVRDKEHLSVTTANPSGMDATKDWFQSNEAKRGVGHDTTGKILPWFHGVLSRDKAEQLVIKKRAGTFLVRISESRFGYVITLRAQPSEPRPHKHFIVEQNAAGQYGLLAWHGDGLRFMRDPLCNTLDELVTYFGRWQINAASGRLMYPCEQQAKTSENLMDLFGEFEQLWMGAPHTDGGGDSGGGHASGSVYV